MQIRSVSSEQLIEWGVAGRALPGETVSGDLHLVRPIADGVLLAVVDGLGHGKEATAASVTAIDIVENHAEEPLVPLFLRCHAALSKTRGVVMTVASLHFSDDRLTWLGVGNVEAVLMREGRSERVLLRSGLVGYQLPELRANMTPIAPGDMLIFATDGINAGFTDGLIVHDPPQQIADRILRQHYRGIDDALVLVVRYVGPQHG